MAKYLQITLAQLVRQTSTVVVKAPDDADRNEVASLVYEVLSDELEWDLDEMWGADEGTHTHSEATQDKAQGRCGIVVDGDGDEMSVIAW